MGYWYYSIFVIIFAWYTFITYGEMYYKSLSLYVKNSKKILLCEKNVIDENGIFAFLKKMALQNYFILYLLLAYFLSKMMSEKLGITRHASFSITRGYLRVNFVRMHVLPWHDLKEETLKLFQHSDICCIQSKNTKFKNVKLLYT